MTSIHSTVKKNNKKKNMTADEDPFKYDMRLIKPW